jgi:hypothetical protein
MVSLHGKLKKRIFNRKPELQAASSKLPVAIQLNEFAPWIIETLF